MAKGEKITVNGVEYKSPSTAARELLKTTELKQSDIAKLTGIRPQTVHRIMLVAAGIRRK